MKSLLWHISDVGEYVSEPSARVNAVQLDGLDQAVHGGGALNRPGFVGGSNFQIGWSRYEQDDEQILP